MPRHLNYHSLFLAPSSPHHDLTHALLYPLPDRRQINTLALAERNAGGTGAGIGRRDYPGGDAATAADAAQSTNTTTSTNTGTGGVERDKGWVCRCGGSRRGSERYEILELRLLVIRRPSAVLVPAGFSCPSGTGAVLSIKIPLTPQKGFR